MTLACWSGHCKWSRSVNAALVQMSSVLGYSRQLVPSERRERHLPAVHSLPGQPKRSGRPATGPGARHFGRSS